MHSDGFESAFTDPSRLINERYHMEFARLAGNNPRDRFTTMVQAVDHQEGSLYQRDDLTALLMSVADNNY